MTARYADEYRQAANDVLESGWFLRGEQTRAFESAYATYIGTRHCICVGNGLDALTLIYRAYKELGRLKEGDEVLVPANTYIASILAITENGLRPVLVDAQWDTLEIDDELIERCITPRTRSLLLVHLYGRNAYTNRIADICRRHHLLLVEDNAQAHGARGKDDARTGSLGDAAGHSFYPSKNLGAMGDAGAVTTDDDELAAMVRALGNYGSSERYVFDYVGRNSRIDELQAAFLQVRLQHLDADNARRRTIARRYESGLNRDIVQLPLTMADGENVYQIFPVLTKQRDALQPYLMQNGVQTLIHYPIPPHRQRCYVGVWQGVELPVTERISAEELSLPISPVMTDDEVNEVIRLVNAFH